MAPKGPEGTINEQWKLGAGVDLFKYVLLPQSLPQIGGTAEGLR